MYLAAVSCFSGSLLLCYLLGSIPADHFIHTAPLTHVRGFLHFRDGTFTSVNDLNASSSSGND